MLVSCLIAPLLLAARSVSAADPLDTESSEAQTSPLKLQVSASFPQAEVFGVKLVNRVPTECLLSFTNNELEPVTINILGGSLWTGRPGSEDTQLMRNLTAQTFNAKIPAGEAQTLEYKFVTDMHPQDVTLKLAALVTDHEGAFHSFAAYNELVSVVEAPTSIFDPQIVFLYLMLAGVFVGAAYFVYSTWVTTLFPQLAAKKRGKDGSRAKASSRGSKKVDGSTEQVAVAGADGPAVTSGSKAYDESWIPAELMNRPQAKRIKSGTPSGVKKTKAVQ